MKRILFAAVYILFCVIINVSILSKGVDIYAYKDTGQTSGNSTAQKRKYFCYE